MSLSSRVPTTDPKYALPTVTATATQVLRIVKAPRDLTNEDRLLVTSSVLSTMSQSPATQLAVCEIVLNLFLLGIPELAAVPMSFTSVKVESVAPTRADLTRWVKLEEGELTAEGKKLPALWADVKEAAHSVTNQAAVYVGLSSLLFCLGKQATESARSSIMDRRPDALIRRFDIQEADQILFPGREAGPTREVLEGLYNTFANYAEVREYIVKFFLALRHSNQHLPVSLEIMMTNFSLMRGAGMTHVEAIIQLARAHPWTLRVPELQPYYHKFMSDLEVYTQIPASIRPYHRLLRPQAEYLFTSSELRPLIAVAGAFMEDVEKTYAGYVYNKGAYQKLIDQVRAYIPHYKPVANLTRLATLLEVADAPLPDLEAPAPERADEEMGDN